MKRIILILVFAITFNFSFYGLYAQNDRTDIPKVSSSVVSDSIPAPDEFIPAEKYPECDMGALRKSIVYPEDARRKGIEGEVIVRALIDEEGKQTKTLIEHSDNSLLNDAALNAVKQTKFTPAIQKGKSIKCWVSIPIRFKLLDGGLSPFEKFLNWLF